jgi:hypothetical protein
MPITILGVFCEDIREEKGGTDTLVGILPDNVGVPSFPGGFPRLSIYVRVILPLDFEPSPIELSMIAPTGERVSLSQIEVGEIAEALKAGGEAGNPTAGMVFRTTFGGFAVPSACRVQALVKIKDEEHLACFLNVIAAEV